MKPLEPEQYAFLSEREKGPLGRWITHRERVLWNSAASLGWASKGIVDTSIFDEERFPGATAQWRLTEAGQRAARIHRAYLASMVTA